MIKTNRQSEVFEKCNNLLCEAINDVLFDKRQNWYQMNTVRTLFKVLYQSDHSIINEKLVNKFEEIINDFDHSKVNLNMNDYRSDKGYITREFTDLLKYRFKQWLLKYEKITDHECNTITNKEAKDFVKLFEKLGVF